MLTLGADGFNESCRLFQPNLFSCEALDLTLFEGSASEFWQDLCGLEIASSQRPVASSFRAEGAIKLSVIIPRGSTRSHPEHGS